MVIITSYKFTHTAFVTMEGSPDPGGIPFRFIVKGTITVGFILLFLQSISMGLHSVLKIAGRESTEDEG
jgi:TRAP-type mannitol/chloroaromatic compound transport system permease small subunit